MPIAKIQLPDGRIAKFDVAEGTTPEQVMAFAQSQLANKEQTKPFDPTADMSGTEKFVAGMGKSVADTGSGLKQLVGPALRLGLSPEQKLKAVTEEQAAIDEEKRLSAPLMKSGAGLAGNVTGSVMQMALPGGMLKTGGAALLKAAPNSARAAAMGNALTKAGSTLNQASTLKNAALQGAVYSGIQPVATGESRMQNTLFGGIAGAGGQLVGRAIGAGYGLGKSILEPLYQGGRENIAARTLQRFAGNADKAAKSMAVAREIIPGSMPTAAQASQDVGIARLEKAIKQVSNQAGDAFRDREVSQNAARVAALRGIAGDEAQMAAAQSSRKSAIAPLRQAISQSTAEANPARTANLIDRMLKGSYGQRQQLASVLNRIKSNLFEPYPLTQRAKEAWDALDAVVKNPKGAAANKANFDVLTQARTVMGRLKKGQPRQTHGHGSTATEAGDALAQLKGMKTSSKAINAALENARSLLKAGDVRYKTSPEVLYGVRQDIADVLAAKGPDGSKINEAIARELQTVMKSLDRQITKAAPEYSQYLKTYAEKSIPIDRMKVGQEILKKSTSATETMEGNPRLYPEAFARAMRDEKQIVKSATGFKRNKGIEGLMSPDQMATLNAVNQDLTRSASARELASAVGSDTAQNLVSQNILRQTFGPLGMPSGWGEATGLLTLMKPAQMVYNKIAEPRVQKELAEALLDPKKATDLLRRLPQSSPQRQALVRALMHPALPVSTAVSAQN